MLNRPSIQLAYALDQVTHADVNPLFGDSAADSELEVPLREGAGG